MGTRRISSTAHSRPHRIATTRAASQSRHSGEPVRTADRRLVVVSANSSWNLLNFCKGQIRGLQEAGYSVAAIVPPDGGTEQLEQLGAEIHTVPLSLHGMSPLSDLRAVVRYLSLLRLIRPAAYLGITAKPNIYGGIAAQLCGIPVINTVTGLGTGFLSGRLLEKIVSGLYWAAFRRSCRVFFLNRDDYELFVGRRLVKPETAAVIPGSGIDLDYFEAAPPRRSKELTFLFIGRLLTDKGVREYLEAARTVKEQVPQARFQILGPADPHPKAVPAELLDDYQRQGLVEMLGSTDDVRPYISNADCVVLPSYREGLPRALVEASSMARPVIASDVPGCREVVDDGATGYLCEARSPQALAAAILKFAALSPAERETMGGAGRRKAEREFGDEHVVRAYVSALDSILATCKGAGQLEA